MKTSVGLAGGFLNLCSHSHVIHPLKVAPDGLAAQFEEGLVQTPRRTLLEGQTWGRDDMTNL